MSDSRPRPPRYTQRPFPAYRFVPGESPHPTRDPQGHSYNQSPETPGRFDPGRWQECQIYLYGIDLFNHGYWWEAHEALEELWKTAGRHTQTGQFIQGLILIAAAQLKHLQGYHDTAGQMARDGLEKMRPVEGDYLGIKVAALREAVESWCAGDATAPIIIHLQGD